MIDLPFAVSPVVVGLVADPAAAGRDGWFGLALENDSAFKIIFALPGHRAGHASSSRCRSSIREVVPVLHEIGDEQEQAARDLGANWLADVLADHAAGDPVGRRPTASC